MRVLILVALAACALSLSPIAAVNAVAQQAPATQEITQCVLQSDVEHHARKTADIIIKRHEEATGAYVTNPVRMKLIQILTEEVESAYRIVESKDDCPAGMNMFYPPRE